MRGLLGRAFTLARVRAVRGATTVPADTPDDIALAVTELLEALRRDNNFEVADLVSAIFTVTPDLTSAFPAESARKAGWSDVPLLCSAEIAVPGSLPRCVRVLVHVERRWDVAPAHVYLRDAVALRPDLHRNGTAS
ncbi:MAG: chorismate mutase [Gemmatimonadales bacterium]